MSSQVNNFWTNIAVGIIGLFVGLDNLLRWIRHDSPVYSLVIGIVCTVLATIWIVSVLIRKNRLK